MMKRYINYSIVYAVSAMIGGVFYLGYDVLFGFECCFYLCSS